MPLKLTNFERFIFYDNRPDYPWHVMIRLHLSGENKISESEFASEMALKRHPLLTSHVKKTGSKLSWVPAEQSLVDQASKLIPTDQDCPEMQFVDLEKEIGYRVFYKHSNGNTILTFQMHHCCLDGKGGLDVVNDWLTVYHQECSTAEKRALPTLEPKLLSQRSRFGRGFWQRIKMIPSQSTALLGVREFLSHKPVTILPDENPRYGTKIAKPYSSVLIHRFNSQETKLIKQKSRANSCSINDLLICSTFMGIHQWRDSQGEKAKDEWIRIMVPISLRSNFEDKMPATNVIGSVFIDRRSCDTDDKQKLLRGVLKQMRIIKRHQLGFAFLWTLWLQNLIPGALQKTANSEECLNSATLTNLGPMLTHSSLCDETGCLVAGNCTLTAVDVVAPIRPKNQASFAVYTFAGKLSISLHYDPRVMSEADAQQLLDLANERLLEFPSQASES